MPGTLVLNICIDDDVAAIHLDAELLGVESVGDGTAAGRHQQADRRQLLRSCRRARLHFDVDALGAGLGAMVTFVPVMRP